MNDFKLVIGLENHVRLNTKEKLFCRCLSEKETCAICLGFPGTLPQLNIEALEKAVYLASALGFSINEQQFFDRKHFFYPDMPKMFQITQQFLPLGKNGSLTLSSSIIDIEKIALEEDAAKIITQEEKSEIDFTRSGSPLAEITTRPCFSHIDQVCEYLTLIKAICTAFNIIENSSNSLRCDVNISLIYQEKSFPRTELKNVNSLRDIKNAVEYEIKRQKELILQNSEIKLETRGWDGTQTYHLRYKETEKDYTFIPEYDITNIHIEKNWWRENPFQSFFQIDKQNLNQEETKKLWRICEKNRGSFLQKCLQKNLSLVNLLTILDFDNLPLDEYLVSLISTSLSAKKINTTFIPEIINSYQNDQNFSINNFYFKELNNKELMEIIQEIPQDKITVSFVQKVIKEKSRSYYADSDKIESCIKDLKNDHQK